MDNVTDIIEDLKNILDTLGGNLQSWEIICDSPFDERNVEITIEAVNKVIEDVSYIHSFFQSYDNHLPDNMTEDLLYFLGLLLGELNTRKNVLLELMIENDSRNRGRPSIKIDEEQVHGLKGLNFSWIAKMLGISARTLRRKRSTFQTVCPTYIELTDDELGLLITEIVSNHPNAGQRVIIGHLVSKGYRVARWKIRRCLAEVDPGRVDRMKKRRIRRRVYSVPSPNSLW